MIGDQFDMIRRIKAVLPDRWFADVTPTLDTVLAGPAHAWATIHELLRWAALQLRFGTAAASSLDALSRDFFGSMMVRRTDEADEVFRSRLLPELLRERGTRQAVRRSLLDITGRLPEIFEPAHCGDTGAYGGLGLVGGTRLAYGSAGRWGNLEHPFQIFVTTYRPAGLDEPGGVGWGGGGYNLGYNAYTDLDVIRGRVADQDISDAVTRVLPIGTTCWMRIAG